MRRGRSPSRSPAHKRQRLSSPTYEDQLGELTQEDLAAFDEIEARISQGKVTRLRKKAGHGHLALPVLSLQDEPASSFSKPRSAMLSDESENPFSVAFSSASNLFSKEPNGKPDLAVALPSTNIDPSPSPERPPANRSYDDWFSPAPANMSTDFGVVSFTTASSFQGFGKTSFIKPSEASLQKAKARLAAWDVEESILEGARDVATSPTRASLSSFKKASHVRAKRPVLATLPNILNAPDSPTLLAGPSKVKTTSLPPRNSGFKSPLQTASVSTTSHLSGSPLNPNFTTSSTSGSRHPLSGTPITAAQPMQNTTDAHTTPSKFSTPVRSRPAKFLTPFKPNMRPGEPGHLALSHLRNPSTTMPQKDTGSAVTHNSTAPRKQFFSLVPPPGRKTLATSGLKPQQYDGEDYHSLGIDITMLNQVTPATALYYVFHSRNSQNLGPAEALNELHRRGCTMATKPWVDNHWCLILWKLAGMVALDPQRELLPEQKRWSWSEVLRQLVYRYEREHNSGIRPPFQKIANQDVPACHPMVLCVSNILWSPEMTDNGIPIDAHPELEVTDGWYRLKAQIDLQMARAVRKGAIRIGRKFGVAGARLSTERKEPSEILEAYNSTKLILSANSSHLVAWHTKLGFTRGPCISTLHKLDPDGGLIASLDLVIVRSHPIAFLEFMKTEDGRIERLGPRNEAEEQQVHDRWRKRRELEASKLQEEFDKKFRCYERYIERLEARAGQLLHNADGDDPHDEIESFFDKLEYPDTAIEVLTRVTPYQAALLARRTRQHVELGRQTASEEIERELQESCPPREVRAFRVLIVQDSRTCRKPANRTAQLTVWNVMSLALDEGSKAGDFAVGQRYLIFNVVPTSLSAWMDREPGSEIFLSTRRDTKWVRIKTP